MQDGHINHSKTRVTKRLEKGRVSGDLDLGDLVMQHADSLGREEMNANTSLFMIAGTETTGNTTQSAHVPPSYPPRAAADATGMEQDAAWITSVQSMWGGGASCTLLNK
jgi:hypothetical protein